MSESVTPSWLETMRWLAAQTGFPARRLPPRAELLLLIAAAAATEERAVAGPAGARLAFNPNHNAQIRNYTAQRRRAHLRSDNSAKT